MHIERIEPNTKEWNLYYANHITRYEFSNTEFKKKSYNTILDIASGVGYGSYYLAKQGYQLVTGVDIDQSALKLANNNFASKNLKFIHDDCNQLSIVNKEKYDAIVSLETLEHLINYKKFTKQLFSMLNSGGKLIISTPNILVTEHHSKKDWHYHEKEFTPKEFVDLISDAGFQSIKLYGQQYTQIGKLRNSLRHEINILRSNPFQRLGMWIQKIMKGHSFDFPLPENKEDFEILEMTIDECTILQKDGPFVLIITGEK